MIENFEAVIGANIRDFQRELAEVDAIIRETALGAEAMIGADVSEFMQEAASVESVVQEITNSEPSVEVDADIAGFMAQAAVVEATVAAVATSEPTVTFDADTAVAEAQAVGFIARLRALTARNFVIRMRTSWNNYQQVLGQMATFSRNFGEFTGMIGRGGMMLVSPAAIPVLASAVGLVGNLGPMLGVLGGATFGLATAFGAAGIGAVGFAAVAIPAIKGIIERSKEAEELQEKIANATTAKQANKYIKQMDALYKDISKKQLAAMKGLREFKEFYAGFAKSLQEPMLDVFINGMLTIQNLMKTAKPMIENVTVSVGKLLNSFNQNLKSADVKDFFTFLSERAAPALEAVAKSTGNFMMGFFNMMEAFGPMSVNMQNGFLGMSESFRNWAASLSESKKFQSFVSYVTENMPKLRSIFGDAIMGIVNMFSAFGGSSSDMMTSLQDMMARFREWSAALGESQGFKDFIDYIKTNGPVVVSTIGGIVDTLIEMGIALAPAGEAILDIADKFFEFTSKLLDAHPWIGRVGTAALLLGGAFLIALPSIAALNALLGGLITTMIVFVAKQTWAAAVSVAKWLWMATTATASAIRQAAAWTLATGVAMVTAVAKMIASAAIFVARWTLMGVQALLHAAKVAAAWTLSTGAAMVVAVAKMAATAAVFVAKWLWMGAQALFAAARMAAAWFIALGPIGWVIGAIVGLAILIIANWDKISAWTKKTWSTVSTWISTKWSEIKRKTSEAVSNMWNTVKTKFTEIVNSVREKMDNARSTIQEKWEAAKVAASQKLAEIVVAAAKFLGEVVSKVREKMGEAVQVLGEKVGEMPGKVLSFVGDMLSAGADLVSGLINGIKNMGSAAVEAISGVVGGVISKAKSLLDINSPSRVFSEFGGYVSEGLANGVSDKAKLAVDNVARMASQMTSAFRPQLAMNDMRASAQLDTSINRADMGVVRKSFAAEISPVDIEQPEMFLVVDGRALGKVVAGPVREENEKYDGIIKLGRGGR